MGLRGREARGEIRENNARWAAWHTGPGTSVGEGPRGPATSELGGHDELQILGDDDYRGGGPYPEEGRFAGVGPRGWQPNERIREEVCRAMADDTWLDATDIEVEVRDCEITLTGTVPSRAQKRIADHLAHRVRGVHDVHNRLAIRGERRHRDATPGGDRNRPE